jgi:LacI family transcriptional regulator
MDEQAARKFRNHPMTKKKVTIIDIARKLDLAKSTVSRALSDHPRISEATKKAVKNLAKKLNFEPNSLAISLFKKRSHTIGVIVPEIVNHFFASAIDGIEDVAYKAGYRVLICKSDESYVREVLNTSALISHRVDGLLISLSKDSRNADHLIAAHKKGTPIVMFDRVSEKLEVNKVVVNDAEGAFTAVEFLITSGYKNIAHLAGPRSLLISKSRKNGYLKALRKHNLPVKDDLIIEVDMNLKSGFAGAQKLLALASPPDAIFAANDQVAMGAMQAIKEKKLRIPQDIAIVGFSNEPFAAITEPSLTTIHQPAFEIGQTACSLLIKKLEAKNSVAKTEKIVLKTMLIKRNSA